MAPASLWRSHDENNGKPYGNTNTSHWRSCTDLFMWIRRKAILCAPPFKSPQNILYRNNNEDPENEILTKFKLIWDGGIIVIHSTSIQIFPHNTTPTSVLLVHSKNKIKIHKIRWLDWPRDGCYGYPTSSGGCPHSWIGLITLKKVIKIT